MSDDVIATLNASPPRRFMGTAMLVLLGGLLIYLGLSLTLGLSQIGLVLGGVLALALGMRLHSVTGQVLELTAQELRVAGGETLARVAEVEKVERGAFAFKPSNGFLITLSHSGPRRWAPGLYWSFSRKIGIGGVTGAPQTKAMAEALSGLIALRAEA